MRRVGAGPDHGDQFLGPTFRPDDRFGALYGCEIERNGPFRLLGTGPRAAARQAAALFALAGLLALVGVPGDPSRSGDLVAIAGCDLTAALGAALFPWERTRPNAPAVLGLPGFAVLGFSTWSLGGVAVGTGPFLVLLYAWAALHFPRWILLAYALPAALAYVLPLVLTGQPLVLSSALVLMPVALAVAFLIEAQARHLRDDRERLARIERWRSAMMSTLAHDVRSPLATVQVALEELKDEATGPAEPMLAAALRQTARISRLAEGLLDVHRIDSTGHLKLDRRTQPALRLAQDALADIGRGADVTIEADPDLTIYVDEQRFEQIIANLVGNALRYGRPPVVVTITGDGRTDRLEVRDHGPGIPDQLRTTLFSQFAVGGPEGVGLGLWIVRQLAEAHGGHAVAEARNPGVAMVVDFPAASRPPAAAGLRAHHRAR